MKYHYSYITTNIITGKQYVGDHSTNNLEDGYLGSGTYLLRAIKKYGKENFRKKILEFFSSKSLAFSNQEKWINEYNTLSPNGYNLSPVGGIGVPNSFHSEETKEKIRIGNLGQKRSNITKQKISTTRKNNKLAVGENNGMSGKNHSIKSKILIGIKSSERNMTDESKHKISLTTKGENNGMFGRNHTLETKEKIRKKLLGGKVSEKTKLKHKRRDNCKYCGFETNISNLNRYHNENCKYK